MMKCSEAQKLIPGYVDARLDGDDTNHLELHLDACRECRLEEQSQRKLATLLSAWEPANPSRTFQDLLALVPEKNLNAGGFFRLLPIPQWAAACLMVLTIGLGFGAGAVFHQENPTAPPSQQQVASAIDLTGYDDAIETGLLMGASSSSGKGGQR